MSRRIGKVSPAFIRELARRAAQMMLERGAAGPEAQDFDRSLEDMMARGGPITTGLLGAQRFGFVAAPVE